MYLWLQLMTVKMLIKALDLSLSYQAFVSPAIVCKSCENGNV